MVHRHRSARPGTPDVALICGGGSQQQDHAPPPQCAGAIHPDRRSLVEAVCDGFQIGRHTDGGLSEVTRRHETAPAGPPRLGGAYRRRPPPHLTRTPSGQRLGHVAPHLAHEPGLVATRGDLAMATMSLFSHQLVTGTERRIRVALRASRSAHQERDGVEDGGVVPLIMPPAAWPRTASWWRRRRGWPRARTWR